MLQDPPNRKQLLTDFYSKYAPKEVLTDERLAAIDNIYGGNHERLITDLYNKYAPDQDMPGERIDAILNKYGLKKKDSGVPYFIAAPDGQQNLSNPSSSVQQPETSDLMANGLTEEQDKQKSLQELAVTPNGNVINIPRQVTPQEQQGLDFVDQFRQTQEKELRQIAGVDEKPMTGMEIHNSTLGALNKPIVDLVSSVPKAGAIVRKAADDLFLGESKPIENYDLFKLGKAIDKGALEIGLTATDPRSAGDVKELLASGIGSALSLMMLGGQGGTTEKIAKAATEGLTLKSATKNTIKELAGHMTSPMGLGGANVMGMQEMEQALSSGASDEQAFGVYLANAGLGSTESVTFARALDRLNKITNGNVMKFLTASTQGGIEEATQEGVQQYLTNKIAQGTYDPKRESWQDMISSMGVGAFVGFILPGILHFANSLPSDQGKATMAAVNEALKNQPVTQNVTPGAGKGKISDVEQLTQELKNEKPSKPTPTTEPAATEGGATETSVGPGTIGSVPEATKEEVVPREGAQNTEKVLGKTKSGKEVKFGAQISDLSDFTAQDFSDAAGLHFVASQNTTDKALTEYHEQIGKDFIQRSSDLGRTFGKQGFKVIGVNSDGETIGEDKNGVRARLTGPKGNIVVTQPVGIVPTKAGIETQSNPPEGEFLTTEELNQKSESFKPDFEHLLKDHADDFNKLRSNLTSVDMERFLRRIEFSGKIKIEC